MQNDLVHPKEEWMFNKYPSQWAPKTKKILTCKMKTDTIINKTLVQQINKKLTIQKLNN